MEGDEEIKIYIKKNVRLGLKEEEKGNGWWRKKKEIKERKENGRVWCRGGVWILLIIKR